MNTTAKALIHKARDVGCEFYLSDGRWKMRGPRNTAEGLLALTEYYAEAICQELSRAKTPNEIVSMQADYMLSKRPPIWRPKVT